jgi:hypothetical protein
MTSYDISSDGEAVVYSSADAAGKSRAWLARLDSMAAHQRRFVRAVISNGLSLLIFGITARSPASGFRVGVHAAHHSAKDSSVPFSSPI